MDVIGKCMSNMNLEPMKEPKGFIKVIEWVLSIFAFATTTSVNTQIAISATCPAGAPSAREVMQISYPFGINNVKFGVPLCRNENTTNSEMSLIEGSKSSAEFYVFVGVIVFLYCLAAIILYVFFEELYRRNNTWSIVDFVISVVITALWLISSSAWAQGVVNLKYYTDFEECGLFGRISDCANGACKQDEFPNFASLNVSIIFGFLNMLVWGGNLWFLYKETPWFRGSTEQQSSAGQEPPVDPQRI